MVIKTLTCHDVYNYGASLQAYALQEFLKQQGHNIKIIDYIPGYIKHVPKFWEIRTSSKYSHIVKYNPILRLVYSLIVLKRYRSWEARRNRFDWFTKTYLNLTRKYTSISELRQAPPDGDCYIVGSDQVWNSYLQNGRDDAFFLDFGDNKITRISYAASFGTSSIHPDYVDYTKEKLKHFNALSIREKSGVDMVEKLGFKARQVIDPVFLLGKEDWSALAESAMIHNGDRYVLLYQIYRDNKLMKEIAQNISQRYSCKIIAVRTTFNVDYADRNVRDAGPLEFLKLIKGAICVVSDSFHATAFSSIFNSPFYVAISETITNKSRLIEFCEKIGCSSRYNPPIGELDIDSINWTKVNNVLKEDIKDSIHFLINNISFQ